MQVLQERLSEVSILARPEGRALRNAQVNAKGFAPFQSSPAPKGGRYSTRRGFPPSVLRFNPRPPRRAGATWEQLHQNLAAKGFNPRPPRRAGATCVPCTLAYTRCVSILARPEGRALPTSEGVKLNPYKFQSSPAPKGGRYVM